MAKHTKHARRVVVIFRRWRTGTGVIALMPFEPATADGRYCTSFEHVGQHCAADYAGVIRQSRPATAEEYAPLLRELQAAPYRYRFNVRRRATRRGGARTGGDHGDQ